MNLKAASRFNGRRQLFQHLEEALIDAQQHVMTNGQETARSIAEKNLARIEAMDNREPGLYSVMKINPDALLRFTDASVRSFVHRPGCGGTSD